MNTHCYQKRFFNMSRTMFSTSRSRLLASSTSFVDWPCWKLGWSRPDTTVDRLRAPCIRHTGMPYAAGFLQRSLVDLQRALH